MPDAALMGPYLRRFLLEDLVQDRNLSRNSQKSYRDALVLLLRFMDQRLSIAAEALRVEQVTPEAVRGFLEYVEKDRGCSTTTRNHRLSVVHALFRFIAGRAPELVEIASRVQAIPFRRVAIETMPYMEKEELDAVLAVPDKADVRGQRDYTLLLFLYNTGARADEAARLTIDALNLGGSSFVRILGKGGKTRLCPLWPEMVKALKTMLGARLEGNGDAPVFLNVRGASITRYGIYSLVKRTVTRATIAMPALANKRISPHTFRHTTAVHLLRAGVDPNTIRAWLGHVSLETTNRYAEVDLEMKAKALAACAVTESGRADAIRKWRRAGLMAFLTSL